MTRAAWVLALALALGFTPAHALSPRTRAVIQSGQTPAPARTLVAAMTNRPSASRLMVINDLIRCEQNGAIWQTVDLQMVLAAADAQSALLDWALPSRTATAVSSPTFTADRGYTFNGSTNYLSTGYAAATNGRNIGINNLTIAAYERNSLAAANTNSFGAGTTNIIAVRPFNSASGITGYMSSPAQTGVATRANNLGLTSISRPTSGVNSYVRGVFFEALSGGGAGGTFSSQIIFIGGSNNSGISGARAANEAFVLIASGWLAAQHAALERCVTAYMTSLGAQV